MEYAFHSFMHSVFSFFGLHWWFWYGYFRLAAVTSLIVHIVQFKYELSKPYPCIPYEQDFP